MNRQKCSSLVEIYFLNIQKCCSEIRVANRGASFAGLAVRAIGIFQQGNKKEGPQTIQQGNLNFDLNLTQACKCLARLENTTLKPPNIQIMLEKNNLTFDATRLNGFPGAAVGYSQLPCVGCIPWL